MNSTENSVSQPHRDDTADKLGMWLFIFTEMILFVGLFLVYSVYRFKNAEAFHLAAEELSTLVGTINTIILLVSSMTVAMAITSIQKGNKKLSLILIGITLFLAMRFKDGADKDDAKAIFDKLNNDKEFLNILQEAYNGRKKISAELNDLDIMETWELGREFVEIGFDPEQINQQGQYEYRET